MHRILAAALLTAFALAAEARAPEFCFASDPGLPDWDIEDYDPVRDADDWCKLAHHEPHKAKRQLSKAVALVRAANNPNRFYFDAKRGGVATGEHILLLRPWMAERNRDGEAEWQVVQYSVSQLIHLYRTELHVMLIRDASSEYFYEVEVGMGPGRTQPSVELGWTAGGRLAAMYGGVSVRGYDFSRGGWRRCSRHFGAHDNTRLFAWQVKQAVENALDHLGSGEPLHEDDVLGCNAEA